MLLLTVSVDEFSRAQRPLRQEWRHQRPFSVCACVDIGWRVSPGPARAVKETAAADVRQTRPQAPAPRPCRAGATARNNAARAALCEWLSHGDARVIATDYFKGIAAGLLAMIAPSALMLARSATHLLPQLDFIEMLSTLVGMPGNAAAGWTMAVLAGSVVLGTLFAWLEPRIPGDSHARRGILFSVGTWLAIMVFLMPNLDAGLFGLRLSLLLPIGTFALHVVYGAALGWIYGMLAPTGAPELPHRSRL